MDFENTNFEKLDILVVAPHPDDAELGMGGAIMRFLDEGKRVGILDLTSGEPTPHGSLELRKQETDAASAIMKITWRENLGLINRSLEPTLDARKKLASVFRLTQPKWIFAPYWIDAHPDHVAATKLIEDARFWSKLSKTDMPGDRFHPERIFNYFCVHLKQIPQPAFILDITPYWERKLAAISAFESQFITGRPQEPPTFLDQLHHEAAFWGKSIGVAYGEPFASREPVGLASMERLV